MAWTATSKARDVKRQGGGQIVSLRMKLSETIYKGDIVRIDKTTGLVTGSLATAGLATGDVFAGIAAETKTAHAALVTYINVYTTGIFEFNTLDTAAVGDIGEVIYEDSAGNTTQGGSYCVLAATGGHDFKIGTCVDFPSTALRLVRIDDFACNATHGIAT
jgi:hypothetical protein